MPASICFHSNRVQAVHSPVNKILCSRGEAVSRMRTPCAIHAYLPKGIMNSGRSAKVTAL